MTAIMQPKQWYQTRCTRCDALWSGLKTAHCATCHRTFSTITSFDKHRTGPADRRVCVDPAAVGLALLGRDYPCWGITGAESSPRDRARLCKQRVEECV